QEWAMEQIELHSGTKENTVFKVIWKLGDSTYHKISHLTVLDQYFKALGVTKISQL
ncbi:hypothetical protein FA15DRAFT_550985, partial [Coprinopsis marcescibilis]